MNDSNEMKESKRWIVPQPGWLISEFTEAMDKMIDLGRVIFDRESTRE